jgi:hypothetical protein
MDVPGALLDIVLGEGKAVARKSGKR